MVHHQSGQVSAPNSPLKLRATKKHVYERTELLRHEVQRLLDLQAEQHVSMAHQDATSKEQDLSGWTQQGVTTTQEDLSGRTNSKDQARSDPNDHVSTPSSYPLGDLPAGDSSHLDHFDIQRARASHPPMHHASLHRLYWR